MNVFQRKIDWQAISNINDINSKTRSHLVKVYGSLTFAAVMASFGCYMNMLYHFGGILTTILMLVSLISLFSISVNDKVPRLTLYGVFAFLEGVSLGPLLNFVVSLPDGGNIVFVALASTFVLFSCFSITALFAERRSWL